MRSSHKTTSTFSTSLWRCLIEASPTQIPNYKYFKLYQCLCILLWNRHLFGSDFWCYRLVLKGISLSTYFFLINNAACCIIIIPDKENWAPFFVANQFINWYEYYHIGITSSSFIRLCTNPSDLCKVSVPHRI